MELLTQTQVYNEVGATSLSTNEIITKSGAQNIASQKLKRITTDLSDYSDTELIDQFQCEDMIRNEYTIQVSYDGATWSDSTQLLFTAEASSSANSQRVYVKSLKHTYLISGEKLNEEEVGYTIDFNSSKFNRSDNTDGYSFWPKAVNTSKQFVIEKYKIANTEDPTQECSVTLIQVRAGIELVHGDVIDFTYNWSTGRDLDQATRTDCYIDGVQGEYVGFGVNASVALPTGTNVLGFAGDNTGTGEEHAIVDFDSIAKYVEDNRDSASTISGKTIEEALTDQSGLLSCKVYLYTVWFGTGGSAINISYTAYKKTDESSFEWTRNGNYAFDIYGVSKSGSKVLPAYCKTAGNTHGSYKNPPEKMTLSAIFTYYFGSGMFSIETNAEGDLRDGNINA